MIIFSYPSVPASSNTLDNEIALLFYFTPHQLPFSLSLAFIFIDLSFSLTVSLHRSLSLSYSFSPRSLASSLTACGP